MATQSTGGGCSLEIDEMPDGSLKISCRNVDCQGRCSLEIEETPDGGVKIYCRCVT